MQLADDAPAWSQQLLSLLSWKDVKKILSIGGGGGVVELKLLKEVPYSRLWYLDPSPEQCQSLRNNAGKSGLSDRIVEVAQTTFESYQTKERFDRIISVYSWFFLGAERRWLKKMLYLLSPNGIGCILIQNNRSIEAEFNRVFCPDRRMTLTGRQICDALKELPCSVECHTHTKWLSEKDLFENRKLTEPAKIFASFIGARSIEDFSNDDWNKISNMYCSHLKKQGVPLITDFLFIRNLGGGEWRGQRR